MITTILRSRRTGRRWPTAGRVLAAACVGTSVICLGRGLETIALALALYAVVAQLSAMDFDR